MLRWLVLTVLTAAFPLVGCGSSVRAGLANAPRLGGTATADNRVTDVVSNGDDSCVAYTEHGVLRGRLPPCQTRTSALPISSAPVPVPPGALVLPWVDHFYVGWPCPMTTSSRQLRSWSAPSPVVATCSVP
jgi:hypothetical protein